MASTRPPLGFLDLPAELRVRIYKHVFTFSTPIRTSTYVYKKGPRYTNRKTRIYKYKVNLSSQLLRTCKTVLTEGLPYMLTENQFQIEQAKDLAAVKQLVPMRDDKAFLRRLLFTNSGILNGPRLKELKALVGLQEITCQTIGYDPYAPHAFSSTQMANEARDVFFRDFVTPLLQARPGIRLNLDIKIRCSCQQPTYWSEDHVRIHGHWELEDNTQAESSAVSRVDSLADISANSDCMSPLFSKWNAGLVDADLIAQFAFRW